MARDTQVVYLDHLGPPAATTITIPKGTPVELLGGKWAVDDVPLLVKLTGNTHDPHHRYCWVPEDAVLTEQMSRLLDEFVRSQNSLRSAEAAAAGFTSGMRHVQLREATAARRKALLAILPWVEARAREELGLPPTPGEHR